MLTVTPKALAVIQRVTNDRGLEPSPGLRIARGESASARLQVRLVERPQPGDNVMERSGARLYLDSAARPRLAGRRLDVVNQQGRVQFILRAEK